MTLKNVPANGQLDPQFGPDENLFRSINPQYLYEGDRVRAATISELSSRHPSCSFNRSKYSDPECVLSTSRPNDTEIAFVAVNDLPKNVSYSVDPTVKYSFRAQHLPENDNYSHTAVVIDKEEKEMKKFKSTDKHEILKRNLREEIALRLRLYRPGNIDSPAHTAEKSII